MGTSHYTTGRHVCGLRASVFNRSPKASPPASSVESEGLRASKPEALRTTCGPPAATWGVGHCIALPRIGAVVPVSEAAQWLQQLPRGKATAVASAAVASPCSCNARIAGGGKSRLTRVQVFWTCVFTLTTSRRPTAVEICLQWTIRDEGSVDIVCCSLTLFVTVQAKNEASVSCLTAFTSRSSIAHSLENNQIMKHLEHALENGATHGA